jgi:RHS repeat-associated protein
VGAGYTLTNNLRLPGQYFDQETGMHYNWHRYYDPKEGRYISSDPIGLYGGINLYTYVGENPLNGIDPTGLIQIYGNWCGSDWTGGRKESYSPPKSPDYYKSPRDELDGACKTHDICYYKCRNNNKCDKQKRSSCFRLCDHVLTKSAYEIGGFWGDVVGAAIDRPGNRDPEPNDASCSQCK